MRLEQVQELAVERNGLLTRIDGKPKCKLEIIRDPLMGPQKPVLGAEDLWGP